MIKIKNSDPFNTKTIYESWSFNKVSETVQININILDEKYQLKLPIDDSISFSDKTALVNETYTRTISICMRDFELSFDIIPLNQIFLRVKMFNKTIKLGDKGMTYFYYNDEIIDMNQFINQIFMVFGYTESQ